MAVGLGVLVAFLLTTSLQQPVNQAVRWAPPAPCAGDSTETHARRGNPVAVPNLNGMSVLRARTTLARLGLKLDVRSVRMDGPTGVVIAQSPPADNLAMWGDVVIVCSRRSAVFPDVVGLTFDAARKVIQDAGYVPIKINSFVDRASRVGVVFRQQPTAGAAAPHGSVDTLVVGVTPPLAAEPPSLSSQQEGSDTAVSPRAPSPPVSIDAAGPTDWSWLWISAIVVGVLLAVVVTTIKRKDKRQLAALRITPYQHSGHSRIVVAKRHG